jgi:hypothetical protein
MKLALVFTKDIDKYSYDQQKKSLLESGIVDKIKELEYYPTFELLNETLSNYHKMGIKDITYLTESEDWLGVERDLKEEYGHLFNEIKALPLVALPSINNLGSLKEGDTNTSQSQVVPRDTSAHQVKTRTDVPAALRHVQMKRGSHLFLFPCNIPLAGTKQLYSQIIQMMGNEGILVIPSANKNWFQFVPQAGILTILSEYYQMKDVLRTTLFLSLTSQKDNTYAYQTKQISDATKSTLHISSRYNGLANIIPSEKVMDIPGNFPLIHGNQECYNLCIKIAEEMEAIKVSEEEAKREQEKHAKEEERVADKNTVKQVERAADKVEPFIETPSNNVNESSSNNSLLFKRLLEDTEVIDKNMDVEAPDLTDQMIAYIIKCALDFRDGKFSPDQLEKDKKALMDSIKKIIMDDLGLKHDVAAGEQYINDMGFELAVSAAKAVKDALGTRAEYKKKRYTNVSFLVRMKKCKSYPELKKMFDPIK